MQVKLETKMCAYRLQSEKHAQILEVTSVEKGIVLKDL